jgi:hypothetical protein
MVEIMFIIKPIFVNTKRFSMGSERRPGAPARLESSACGGCAILSAADGAPAEVLAWEHFCLEYG